MIKRLKYKFVFLSMISLLVLLTVIITGMNVINYNSVSAQADDILTFLSHNRGRFPDFKDPMTDGKLPNHMSPEVPYESRYFSVLLDEHKNIVETDTSRIKSVDTSKAIEYSNSVINKSQTSGFIDRFRYIINTENNGIRITFLDCGRQLDSFYSFLTASIIMSLIGYIIVFIIILICSERIIKPIAESYEKQKRFITDAGHEIKTPLTIINANVDVLEAEYNENESLEDIKQQTIKLSELTNELIYLAKMEEIDSNLNYIEFPVSDVVSDIVESFRTLAQQKNVQLNAEIEPMLTMKGDIKAIDRLTSILLDNAVKYSPNNGAVSVALIRKNKTIELTVYNSTESRLEKEVSEKVFDRFYRADSSRNSETGGHGIGLSIAKAIVTKHNGKIFAETRDNNHFCITTVFPA